MSVWSDQFLNRCLWMAEKMIQPTLRNGLSSFEEWESRTGLWRDIQRLENLKLIEVEGGKDTRRLDRVIRLTTLGRTIAHGGALPPERWDRGWDGLWRVVVFDVPEHARQQRARLRKCLADARFGQLQRSVWISPDPLGPLAAKVMTATSDCATLTVFEGPTCLGEGSAEIVPLAWDFNRVEATYSHWRLHADTLDAPRPSGQGHDWPAWLDRERALWRDCLAADPLLPRELWPKDYSGEQCWNLRLQRMANPADPPSAGSAPTSRSLSRDPPA